eukprot:gene5376-5428_t
MIYRVSSAHEEAGERLYAVSTEEFIGDGAGSVKAIKLVETEFINGKFEKVANSEREIPADLVFLAMGFLGPEKSDLITQLEVELDERGNEYLSAEMLVAVNHSLSGRLQKVEAPLPRLMNSYWERPDFQHQFSQLRDLSLFKGI